MISDKELQDLSDLFQAFSEPNRIRILMLLKEETLNVSSLAKRLDQSPSAISHQLRILRNVNLVSYEKKGKEVYYSLADDHVHVIFSQAIEHVNE